MSHSGFMCNSQCFEFIKILIKTRLPLDVYLLTKSNLLTIKIESQNTRLIADTGTLGYFTQLTCITTLEQIN